MLVELALQELRKSLHLTQEQVAEMMQMNQAAISKMESSLLFKNYANLSI
jgi:transcriptional regulator with XRE-family HTH domain